MAFDERFNGGNACEARYYGAIEARKMANARKTKAEKYGATENGKIVNDYFFEDGEFAPTYVNNDTGEVVTAEAYNAMVDEVFAGIDPDDYRAYQEALDDHHPRNNHYPVTNPLVKMNDFMCNMHEALMNYGALTERQEAAVLKHIEKTRGFVADREAQRDVDRENCQHVGELGKRIRFDLNVVYTHAYDGYYGMTYINIMKDDDGNIVVYKGGKNFARVEAFDDGGFFAGFKPVKRVIFNAKVEEHGERDGVKQTIVKRPTKIEYVAEEEEQAA